MWPYNDDEAGWLKPSPPPKRPIRVPVNDNDPAFRAPLRALPAPPRKADPEA